MTRYALWLLPDEETSQSLSSQIEALSSRFGGPVFSPHITLFGRVSGDEQHLSDQVSELAGQIAPFGTDTQGLTGSAYYFRCFYIRLAKSAELLRTGQMASERFQVSLRSDYRPHISLLYGNQIRQHYATLVTELQDSVPPQIAVSHIQLIKLNVSVSDWQVINTCPLIG